MSTDESGVSVAVFGPMLLNVQFSSVFFFENSWIDSMFVEKKGHNETFQSFCLRKNLVNAKDDHRTLRFLLWKIFDEWNVDITNFSMFLHCRKISIWSGRHHEKFLVQKIFRTGSTLPVNALFPAFVFLFWCLGRFVIYFRDISRR